MSVVLQIVKIYESCQPVGAWDRREPEGRMHDGEVVFYFKSECTTLSKIGNNFAPKLVKLKASRVSAYGFRIGTSYVNGVQYFSTLVACKGDLSALKLLKADDEIWTGPPC